MVAITLSPEQIRTAPPEVRRWLEQELFAAFGLQPPAVKLDSPQLAALSVEEVAAVLSMIQGTLPVGNVFFELGREGIPVDTGELAAFRLVDTLQHTRLQTLEQVFTCFDTITAAARRVRGNADAAFYGHDSRGHCFISAQTQRSILHVWRTIIASRDLDASRTPIGDLGMSQPASFPSGTPAFLPSSSIWSTPARTTNGGAPGQSTPDVISS